MRSLMITHYCWGDEIEKNEMGGACNGYGGEEGHKQGFGGGNLRERDHLWDSGVDGIFRKWDVVLWTDLIWFRIGTGGWHLGMS